MIKESIQTLLLNYSTVMKKMVVLLAIIAFGMNVTAQSVNDSLRKNEFSVSVLPMFVAFAGASSGNTFTNFNFGYKRYIKNKYAFRTALVFFPASAYRYNNGVPEYYNTVDTMNYFRIANTSGTKLQLNLGAERIYTMKRFMHGIGADICFSYQRVNSNEDFYKQRVNTATSVPWAYYPVNFDQRVDTMSRFYQLKGFGVGTQVFYSLRFRMSEKFYLSSTIGPYLNLSFMKCMNSNISEMKVGSVFSNIDLNSIWVSDLSIAYRF